MIILSHLMLEDLFCKTRKVENLKPKGAVGITLRAYDGIQGQSHSQSRACWGGYRVESLREAQWVCGEFEVREPRVFSSYTNDSEIGLNVTTPTTVH